MNKLAKDLGLLEALPIGVGTMIGAGIFVLSGSTTEAGLLSRLTGDVGSLEGGTVDASVLLAEKAHDRSLKERLFGSSPDVASALGDRWDDPSPTSAGGGSLPSAFPPPTKPSGGPLVL